MPDLNVWLALATARHQHHAAAAAWIDSVDSGEIVFCRVTQVGLLRLLSNRAVMGPELLSPSKAWEVFDAIAADPRVRFASEPPGVEPIWRRLTAMETPLVSGWTDMYLLAYSRAEDLRLVTFDRSLQAHSPAEIMLLG